MGATTFSGPLKAGTAKDGANANIGAVVLAQSAVIDVDADLTQEAIFNVPAGAQLVDFVVDVLAAYDSATSATLTIGSASAGTEYAGGINAKTAGRATLSHSAAQLAAMDDVGANTAIYATVTSVGQPTAGQVRVTARYVQQ